MRADEKIDPELELAAVRDQIVVLEAEQAPELATEEEVATSEMHFHELVAYLEALLHGRSTEIDLSWAGETELQAIALATQAIEGRVSAARMLFAEDRLEMLNQALAALQPALAVGFETASSETRELYELLVHDMSELKQSLESLSDAQEELFLRDQLNLQRAAEEAAGKPGEPGAKPKKKPRIDAGEVGDDRPSTLAGPGPAVELEEAKSTLAGPGPAVERPDAPSTLAGPGPAVERPDAPSTAWDGEPAPPRRAGR